MRYVKPVRHQGFLGRAEKDAKQRRKSNRSLSTHFKSGSRPRNTRIGESQRAQDVILALVFPEQPDEHILRGAHARCSVRGTRTLRWATEKETLCTAGRWAPGLYSRRSELRSQPPCWMTLAAVRFTDRRRATLAPRPDPPVSTRETTTASGAATKLKSALIFVAARTAPCGKAAVAKKRDTVKIRLRQRRRPRANRPFEVPAAGVHERAVQDPRRAGLRLVCRKGSPASTQYVPTPICSNGTPAFANRNSSRTKNPTAARRDAVGVGDEQDDRRDAAPRRLLDEADFLRHREELVEGVEAEVDHLGDAVIDDHAVHQRHFAEGIRRSRRSRWIWAGNRAATALSG